MSHYTNQHTNQVQTNTESHLIDSQIEDMQQNHVKNLPDLIPLNPTSSEHLDWLGDSLQVFEFLNTFGHKLKEDCLDFSTIQSSIELFRSGLENRNDKLRKEMNNLTQLFVKLLVKTNTDLAEDEDNQIDDIYLINNLHKMEINELTFSEILRIFLKRSFSFLIKRRSDHIFQVDVTHNLTSRINLYIEGLEANNFEFVKPTIKSGILAFLCDELLQNLNLDSNQSEQDIDSSSMIVNHIDQTLETLSRLRQDKSQLDSKIRSSKSLIDLSGEKRLFSWKKETLD